MWEKVLNSAGLVWGILVVIVGMGGSMYSDISVLRIQVAQLQEDNTVTASIPKDIAVLQRNDDAQQSNLIYLNTKLAEVSEQQLKLLYKMDSRVSTLENRANNTQNNNNLVITKGSK